MFPRGLLGSSGRCTFLPLNILKKIKGSGGGREGGGRTVLPGGGLLAPTCGTGPGPAALHPLPSAAVKLCGNLIDAERGGTRCCRSWAARYQRARKLNFTISLPYYWKQIIFHCAYTSVLFLARMSLKRRNLARCIIAQNANNSLSLTSLSATQLLGSSGRSQPVAGALRDRGQRLPARTPGRAGPLRAAQSSVVLGRGSRCFVSLFLPFLWGLFLLFRAKV